MSLVNVPGNAYWILPIRGVDSTLGSTTVDATGESWFGIGTLYLSSGVGSSKTFSSAGGSIYLRFGAVTFANAGSTIRIGVQDLTAGLEDGTFDVSADLVGGTDTITATAVRQTLMETGTKTLTHGMPLAIGMEFLARAGADSVVVNRSTADLGQMYGCYYSIDTGAGPTKSPGTPSVVLVTDDGTVGWLGQSSLVFNDGVIAVNTGSTPDEYALIFTPVAPARIVGVCAAVNSVASTDTWEVVLYSDPLGTPVAERTVTMDPNLHQSTTGAAWDVGLFTSGFVVAAGTTYAAAFRPTSANPIQLYRMGFGTGNGILRTPTSFGTSASQGTRSDQTGAFSSDTDFMPLIGLLVDQVDNGASTGGGLRLAGPGGLAAGA